MAKKSPMPAMVGGKSDDDYQAEDDHRTLQRSEEVRADPSRMKRVATFHRKKMGEMQRVGQRLGVPATMASPTRKAPKRMASMARPSRGR